MEGRGREEIADIFSENPAKPAGPLTLKNFTIPRKKRVSGQVLLEPCPEESWDYSLIQSKLKESRLDMRKEHANAWRWKDVKLVHNEEFLREFSEKRSEMRTKGRHGREMEEQYCFLVASHEATSQMYQLGLRTENHDQYCLGKPSWGVYLFRHVDVALKHAATSTVSGTNLIIFKVLYGRVKKVTPSTDFTKTPDPTVAFDCHMAKDAVSHRDSLSQQVIGSSVFLFDYNENQELNKRPRQCLPYAVIQFVAAACANLPMPISPPILTSKHHTGALHGPLERLKGCTVAKRSGKGENATVTFKHFTSQDCPGLDYRSQTSGVDITTFQHSELQNPPPFIPQQLYMPFLYSPGYYNPSLPYFDNSTPSQNSLGETVFPLNTVPHTSTPGIYGSNTEACGAIAQPPGERIATIVYSSRTVKDPRLTRQETNIQEKSSEQEKASNVSACDGQGQQPHSACQKKKDKLTTTVFCEKESLQLDNEHGKDGCPKPTDEVPPEPQTKSESMPSFKLFKMKFQKYGVYFKMTEVERQKHVWAKENLTLEQKKSLLDRIHFYELHYQKYKQGMLFQKDNETESGMCSSPREPKTNGLFRSTVEMSTLQNTCEATQAETIHAVSLNASKSASITNLANTKRNLADTLCINSTRRNRSEPKTKRLTDTEQEAGSGSLEHCVESQFEVQIGGENTALEQPLEQGNSLEKLSEKSKVIESTCDTEQPLNQSCPSKHSIINNSTIESNANESILSNHLEMSAGHDITDMDVSNFEEISLLDESESKDISYAFARGQDGNSLIRTENHDEESMTYSDDESEMTVEFRRAESPQDNTIHKALYERLQLNQLLPNLNGHKVSPQKPYLISKCLDKRISQSNHCPKIISQKGEFEKDLRHTVRTNSKQFSANKRPTLSERFSKLRSLHKKLKVFGQEKRLTKSYAGDSTGDEKNDAKTLISSGQGGKNPKRGNVRLIRLMAQRYNEEMSCVSWQCIQGKCSKLLNRRKSKFRSKSSQSLSRVLRKPLHRKKWYLYKAKCKTTQASNVSPQCQALASKLTSGSSNFTSCTTETVGNEFKNLDSCMNSDAMSQLSDFKSYYKLTNNESAHDHSCTDASVSENTPNPAKETPELVYDDVLRILSNGNVKEQQADKATKDPTLTNDMEPERGTTSNHYQKNSSLNTFPRNIDLSNQNKTAKAEQKQVATSRQNKPEASTEQVRENKSDTREIFTNSNTGTYNNSDPVRAVSSIHSDITLGNVISSCTAKAQTATNPDLPRAMNNNETSTENSTKIIYDINMADASSDVTIQAKRNISSDVKEAKEVNVNIQNRYMCNETNSIDAKDKELLPKEDANQSSKKMLKGAKDDSPKILTVDLILRHENVKTAALNTQCRPDVQHSESNRMIDSKMKTTEDLSGKVSVSAKERDVNEKKNNLHSAWQLQVKDGVTNPSETQLITKLRDYLTKFEFSVKRQEKDTQVPMAWITLDSTGHKQQLLESRKNSLNLADLQHQGSDFASTKKDTVLNYMKPSTINKQVPEKANADSQEKSTKQTSKGQQQSKSSSKRIRNCDVKNISPESTGVRDTKKMESYPNESHLPAHKDPSSLQISTSVPNIQLWMPNDNLVQQNQDNHAQGSGNRNGLHGERSQINQLIFGKAQQALYDKKVNTYDQSGYSVTDISSTLKLADHALSLGELIPLQFKCKNMLQYYISNFEKEQRVSFNQSCVSRNLILEKYLDQPPMQVEMKIEALNSFLELQMMIEAWQFVENKINFLRRKPTFRSLLWYDPTLYGELYKGAVGFQQQSSLFSTFQQCLASEGYSKVHEYYIAVSTLHQQLQDSPDTSYYMYLKSKRERLEVEAALRNPPDVKSFFLSVPIAVMINFGDSLEALEKAHRLVMAFVETPSDHLPGMFDVGKAEHLSIICRYLQEKINFLKSSEEISKVSWFGLEHLLYDASKILVWRESEQGVTNEVLMKYKMLNPQIVYGVTEGGIALFNNMEQPPYPMERVITPPKKTEPSKKHRNEQSEISKKMDHSTLNIVHEDGMKKNYQPGKRRATHPPLRFNNNSGAPPLIQSNLPTQLSGNPSYPAFPQQSNIEHWSMPGNFSRDWNQKSGVQPSKTHSEIRTMLLSKRRATTPCTEPRRTSVTDIQNSHAVSQHDWPPSLMMNPRATERINHQPIISVPHAELPKQQASDSTMPPILSFPFLTFPQDAASVVPPPLPPLPFSNTSDQAMARNKPTPINYPYFIFNGQTYSTAVSAVPLSAVHSETQYRPHPV